MLCTVFRYKHVAGGYNAGLHESKTRRLASRDDWTSPGGLTKGGHKWIQQDQALENSKIINIVREGNKYFTK